MKQELPSDAFVTLAQCSESLKKLSPEGFIWKANHIEEIAGLFPDLERLTIWADGQYEVRSVMHSLLVSCTEVFSF